MVNCIFEILDESKKKNISRIEYKTMKMQYKDYMWMVIKSWDETKKVKYEDDDLNFRFDEIDNRNFILPTDKMEKFISKYFCKGLLKSEYQYYDYEKDLEEVFSKHFSFQDLLDYLGVIPFTPSVMINISPDWKSGLLQFSDKHKIRLLTELIEGYLAESERYDYYSYVIENGCMGDHIHAHIVAHINPRLIKSVETHLAKGTHTQQLKKRSLKLKGMEGTIKGPGIQKVFLRNEQLVSDKLDYLIEEKKPDGHKNKSVLTGRIDKVLFTVK